MSKPIEQVFNVQKFDPNNTGFTFGCKVILNPDIFSKEERASKKLIQKGTLNYPNVLLKYEYQVIEHFTDKYHGDMVNLIPIDEKFNSPVTFVLKDCILVE